MESLKPSLSVTLDPGLKTYTVTARILAPNGCYMSLGALPVAPAGQAHPPESQPVTLRIVRQGEICTQALKVLDYRIASLPLSAGVNRVVAFVVLNDVVVATASKPIVSPAPLPEPKSPDAAPAASTGADVLSVNGWIDAMPVAGPRLITVANAWAPCANYQFSFIDRGPFGVTGRTLLLELVATAPEICLRAIFEGPVRFEKPLTTADEFDSVILLFEGAMHFDELEIVS